MHGWCEGVGGGVLIMLRRITGELNHSLYVCFRDVESRAPVLLIILMQI